MWKELEREGVFELVGSLQYNIEINAVGVNKGTGLVNLGKMLGIRREEIMACGDGDNDIAMLKEVGFGVAMANAEEKVKAVADYITESNNDEGAAKAIEKFVLEGRRNHVRSIKGYHFRNCAGITSGFQSVVQVI